jgi:hypothetical protein
LEYNSLADARCKLLDYRDPESNAYDALLGLLYDMPGIWAGIDSSWLFKEGDLMTVDPKPPTTHLTSFLNIVLTIVLIVLPGRVFRLLPVRTLFHFPNPPLPEFRE